MICGVKFCGGCNPRYDRGKAFEDIKKERPDIEFAIAREGEKYDFLIVIGGCTSCCASHCQYTYEQGLIKMWDREHIDKVLDKLDEVATKIDGK